MSKVIRGWTHAGILEELHDGTKHDGPESEIWKKQDRPSDLPVIILPITDEGVGPVEDWMVDLVLAARDGQHPDDIECLDEIARALSRILGARDETV